MSKNDRAVSQTDKAKDNKAIRVRKDRIGRAHLRPMQLTSGHAARFRRIQILVLNGGLEFQSQIVKFIVCLICFDGIVTRGDLMAALSSIIYRWKDDISVEWKDPVNRINRRILSSFSINAWGSPSTTPYTIDEAIEQVESALSKVYSLSPTSPLDCLLRDAQSWLTEVLPGPLLAHCLNLIPMTGLPGSALAREVTGLALNQVTEQGDDRVVIALGQVFDGFFSTTKNDLGSGVITDIIKACRLKGGISKPLQKSRMLEQCLSLAPRACEAGPSPSLLLGWAIDLNESGTRKLANVKPATIPIYIGSTMALLFREIKDLDWDDVTTDELQGIYDRIKEQVADTVKGIVSAALGSFHYFLEEFFDFPPLKKSLFEGVVQPIPRANVIWPHEFDTIKTWLDSSKGNERMLSQVRVSMTLMQRIRIRIGELLTLRLRNIRISPAGLEIEICRMRRDGTLKTNAARRVVQIVDAFAIEIIVDWKHRREKENAISSDLMFGDPHAPDKGYRLGQTYMLINYLLKAATGDSSVSCHATSHTWISEKFEHALLNGRSSDINPLDEPATRAGHASSQTGVVYYFHFFEKVLRHCLDNAIKSIKFTGSIIAKNSNITAESFRQKCCRSKDANQKQEIALGVIRDNRPSLLVPRVQDLFAMNTAKPPGILAQGGSIKFSDVLNIATDLAQGMTVSVVSSRCSKTEELVLSVASVGCLVLEEIRLIDRSAVPRDIIASIADLQRFFTRAGGKPIDFSRTAQPKIVSLRNYFSANPDMALLEQAVNSWVACFDRQYISLERATHGLGLIKLLKEAGIPNDRIVVCVAFPLKDEVTVKKILVQMNPIFIPIFSFPPTIDLKTARHNRPSMYLVVSGVELREDATIGSAATSMAGFNALMFAAAIFLRISVNVDTSVVESSTNLDHGS